MSIAFGKSNYMSYFDLMKSEHSNVLKKHIQKLISVTFKKGQEIHTYNPNHNIIVYEVRNVALYNKYNNEIFFQFAVDDNKLYVKLSPKCKNADKIKIIGLIANRYKRSFET